MSGLRQQRLRLQLQREELRLRCAAQRSRWARQAAQAPLGGESMRRAVLGARLASRWLRAHPGLAAVGAAAGLLLLRPQRALGWASTLLTLWSLWQRAQPLLDSLKGPGGSGSTPRR